MRLILPFFHKFWSVVLGGKNISHACIRKRFFFLVQWYNKKVHIETVTQVLLRTFIVLGPELFLTIVLEHALLFDTFVSAVVLPVAKQFVCLPY